MSRFELPVIDIGPFLAGSPTDTPRIAKEIDAACRSIGFIVLANHGISRQLIDRVFGVGRSFFAQTAEEKQRFCSPDPRAPRGYQVLGARNLGKTFGLDTPPDLREQYFIGPLESRAERFAHIEGTANFYADNIWPEFPATYRSVLSQFYSEMETLGNHLMRLFALALDMERDFFDDKINHHFSTCPLNNYPVVSDALPGQLRTGAHTDFGSLTILALDDAPGGLQVQRGPDSWVDVRPSTDQLIVNLGDMMARWTNDRWRSTVHRVVNPPRDLLSQSHRMSVGYFLHPNYDTEIRCLPTCMEPGEEPLYPPIMAGGHMREKLERHVVG